VPADDLRRIHAWLVAGLKSVESSKRWNFDTGPGREVGLWLSRPTPGRLPTPYGDSTPPPIGASLIANRYPSKGATILDLFAERLFDTVLVAGKEVRHCAADCPNLYVPGHGRQAYCSPRCSQRVRTRNMRHGNPEKAAEVRRRQYLRDHPNSKRKPSDLIVTRLNEALKTP